MSKQPKWWTLIRVVCKAVVIVGLALNAPLFLIPLVIGATKLEITK